ncbi:hypothetical protein M8494_01330 [Serratia ureilytica]
MDFKNSSIITAAFSVPLHDAYRPFNQYGIMPGDCFYQWSRDIIKQYTGKPDITFEQFER